MQSEHFALEEHTVRADYSGVNIWTSKPCLDSTPRSLSGRLRDNFKPDVVSRRRPKIIG